MIWRIVESAIANAMSRALLETRLDTLFERVQRLGVLSDEEISQLRREVMARVEEVEREGRELKQFVERTLANLAETLLRGGRGGKR